MIFHPVIIGQFQRKLLCSTKIANAGTIVAIFGPVKPKDSKGKRVIQVNIK